MMYLLAVILAVAASVEGRTFQNPVIKESNNGGPGAIKINGTYYVVIGSEDMTLPIYTSTNLTNWERASYVFNGNNLPDWGGSFDLLKSPEIHQIGCNYLIYFTASRWILGDIGVAIASHPLGPYTPMAWPILSIDSTIDDPNIIKTEDKLYLVYTKINTIWARELNSNGLSVSPDEPIELLNATLDWEGKFVHSPWYLQRGKYHYLFYSTSIHCYVEVSVAVARSTNVMGPYQKLEYPIIVANQKFRSTGHVSVVKDLDDENDVIFFHAYPASQSCNLLTLLASLEWGQDDWPYVKDF